MPKLKIESQSTAPAGSTVPAEAPATKPEKPTLDSCEYLIFTNNKIKKPFGGAPDKETLQNVINGLDPEDKIGLQLFQRVPLKIEKKVEVSI